MGVSFSLTKWYLDCVDADGRVAIAYWTEVAWRRLAICWHSLAVYNPGSAPLERSSAKAAPAPTSVDGTITWNADQLCCRLTCHSRVPILTRRLLNDRVGAVDWRCESARVDMVIACDGREILRGQGYAECLNMTLLPWQLPIDTLRWGRWLSSSSDRSLVWIDWCGPHPLTAIVLDGAWQQTGVVGDELGAGLWVQLVEGSPRLLRLAVSPRRPRSASFDYISGWPSPLCLEESH